MPTEVQATVSVHSSSRRATSRSSVFDNTVRFDMGRYDFPCDGSRSDFFSNGVMNAALNGVGNTPPVEQLGDKRCKHVGAVLEKTLVMQEACGWQR